MITENSADYNSNKRTVNTYELIYGISEQN